MKVAIMQPYFLPYIGYFQLINAVDVFVVYDNIQFSKKGWFHRNRMLVNGKDEYFTLPLKKDSDYLDVNARFLSDSWAEEKSKTLRKIKENYKKAPNFADFYPILEEILEYPNHNLFEFIFYSLNKLLKILDIKTEIIVSSKLPIDHSLKGQNKVIEICKTLNANHYINPIGGLELYDQQAFGDIELSFLRANSIEYPQFTGPFMPFLSIMDIMMFNDIDSTKALLNEFILQKNIG